MQWIKVKHGLIDDPDVIQMVEFLRAKGSSVDEFGVVGRLVKIWQWADLHTTVGCNAASVTQSWIDRYIGLEFFAEAMSRVGWLVINDTNVEFPNFDRHMSQTAKERAQTAKRVTKHRKSETCNADVTVEALHERYTSVTKPLPEKRREEKKREENKENPLPPTGGDSFDAKSVALPQVLETKEFLATWQSWCDYRAEARKKLKPRSAKAQLAELAEWGHDAAIQSIYQSIRNGWTGLFLPRTNTPYTSKPPPAAPRPWSEVFAEQEQQQANLIELEVRHG